MSSARKYLQAIESTGIRARITRAERMDIGEICRIYSKPVKDMTDPEHTVIDFFLRYHPDPFSAISEHLEKP